MSTFPGAVSHDTTSLPPSPLPSPPMSRNDCLGGLFFAQLSQKFAIGSGPNAGWGTVEWVEVEGQDEEEDGVPSCS